MAHKPGAKSRPWTHIKAEQISPIKQNTCCSGFSNSDKVMGNWTLFSVFCYKNLGNTETCIMKWEETPKPTGGKTSFLRTATWWQPVASVLFQVATGNHFREMSSPLSHPWRMSCSGEEGFKTKSYSQFERSMLLKQSLQTLPFHTLEFSSLLSVSMCFILHSKYPASMRTLSTAPPVHCSEHSHQTEPAGSVHRTLHPRLAARAPTSSARTLSCTPEVIGPLCFSIFQRRLQKLNTWCLKDSF